MKKEELADKVNKLLEQLKDYKFPIWPNEELDDKLKEKVIKGHNLCCYIKSKLRSVIFAIKASDIKDINHPEQRDVLNQRGAGKLVKIRPCGDEYGDKTYLGIYLGDMALGSSVSIEDDKIQCNLTFHNPAIFVPELKKTIFGCESWWGEIKSEEELKEITDEDIDNTFYVALLREQFKKED